MGESEAVHIAAKILECQPYALEEQYPRTYKMLSGMDGLCARVDGRIASRQIVALVVYMTTENE